MNFKKSFFGVLLFVVVIFVSYSIVVFIIGPIDKRRSPYGGTSWSTVKRDSIHRKILRGKLGDLDTLLIVANKIDSLFKPIPYSKNIKFILDTLKNDKKIILINPASGKKIKFRIKDSSWTNIYQKDFRWLERF